MAENNCACYTDEKGNRVTVMLCPIHGDIKARKGIDGSKSNRPSASGMKRSPLKQESDKQGLRQAYLLGVKDSIITAMIEDGAQSWCQRCEKDSGYTTLEESRACLDLHHQDQKRSEGKGYDHKSKDPGVDNPKGLILVCRDCHRELEER